MKAIRGMLAVLVLLAFIFTAIPLARAGPTNEPTVTEQAIVEAVPIVVDSVPPMTTGFDVICNITNVAADTSDMSRLSSTGDKRLLNETSTVRTARSAPLVMLA